MTRDLGQSGVRYRCACGVESEYQREAKLPDGWSLAFVVIDGRTWPRHLCGACAPLPAWRQQPTSKDESERVKLDRLRAEASGTKRRRKKR